MNCRCDGMSTSAGDFGEERGNVCRCGCVALRARVVKRERSRPRRRTAWSGGGGGGGAYTPALVLWRETRATFPAARHNRSRGPACTAAVTREEART